MTGQRGTSNLPGYSIRVSSAAWKNCLKRLRRALSAVVKVEPAAQDSRDFGKPFCQQYAHAECYEKMQALED
jgi:hypothetical protein